MSPASPCASRASKRGALGRRHLERRGEQRLHLQPAFLGNLGTHGSFAASSRRSQARAMAHSRFTDASEMPTTLGGFFEREAAEVAQLDDLALRRVYLFEPQQRGVDGHRRPRHRLSNAATAWTWSTSSAAWVSCRLRRAAPSPRRCAPRWRA